MWKCLDCEKMFHAGSKASSIGAKCPFCGSELVADYSDFHFPKMDGLIPQEGKDSFMDKIVSKEALQAALDYYEKAGIDPPDSCRESGLPEYQSLLSFNDLNINELVLLKEAVLEENECTVRPMTYITDMTERFLHTFIDADFVSV